MSVMQRPPPSQMTFDQRLFWLGEDIHRNSGGMMSAIGGGGAAFGFGGAAVFGGGGGGKQQVGQLQHLMLQARECFAVSGEASSNVTLCEVTPTMLREREAQSLPVEPVPKTVAAAAFHLVLQADSALAEYYEAINQHAQALPIYHATIMLAQKTNQTGTVWIGNDEMVTLRMNLGLCYKRARLYTRAQDWYDRCLPLLEPGDTSLDHNLHWLNVARREDRAVPWPVCWACGKNEQSNPNVDLSACAKCNAEHKPDVARYCSKKCQKADWKHHKKACHSS